MYRAKSYEELEFTNDFIFCKVLSAHPELCKELLEVILDRKVGDFVTAQKQKAVEITPDGKGVRFDVYLEDDRNVVYDMEMQVAGRKDLARRSRYYQGLVDLDHLERGAEYRQLKRSFIIFICLFDEFGMGLPRYTFEYRCVENLDLRLGDGTQKVFLNAKGKLEGISENLAAFLDYVAGKKPNHPLIQKLEAEVENAKHHQKWRKEYMIWHDARDDAREEGREEGLQEGRISMLASLVEDGLLAVKDAAEKLGMTEAEFVAAVEQCKQ